jgi:hypothetical protein
MALLAPLLVPLPGILDDVIRRCFPAAAWGWVNLGRLIADGVLGIDVAQPLSGFLDGVNRCLERPYQPYVVRSISRHISPCPLRVTVVFPLAARLTIAHVLHAPLRLHAHLMGLLAS